MVPIRCELNPFSTSTSTAMTSPRETLDALCDSCDSILSTSLSYRTLTSTTMPYLDDDVNDDDNMYVENEEERGITTNDDGKAGITGIQRLSRKLDLEERVAMWLDEKILDAERQLCKPTPVPATTTSSNTSDKQLELFQKTAQLQLEHMLLNTLVIHQQVVSSSVFVVDQSHDGTRTSSAPPSNDGRHGSTQQQQQQQRLLLLRKAVAARDRQVTKGLQLNRELTELHRRISQVRCECDQIAATNRDLWSKRRQRLLPPPGGTKRSPTNEDDNLEQTQNKDDRITLENKVLQRLLEDLIAGSRLDWYNDERLRRILLREASNS